MTTRQRPQDADEIRDLVQEGYTRVAEERDFPSFRAMTSCV